MESPDFKRVKAGIVWSHAEENQKGGELEVELIRPFFFLLFSLPLRLV